MTEPETSHIHRIGPNAITRVAEALRQSGPQERVERLFTQAGLAHYLAQPPEKMVDEREVTRLHRVLRDQLGIPAALAIARVAGVRTGDYLLAHRIPRAVQVLLKWLPARLASQILLNAIQRHAWTFAGSGELRVRKAYPPHLAIAGCCICQGALAQAQTQGQAMGHAQAQAQAQAQAHAQAHQVQALGQAQAQTPLCDFYAAAIERLFQQLVHPRSRVTETQCQALGAEACTFEVAW